MDQFICITRGGGWTSSFISQGVVGWVSYFVIQGVVVGWISSFV